MKHTHNKVISIILYTIALLFSYTTLPMEPELQEPPIITQLPWSLPLRFSWTKPDTPIELTQTHVIPLPLSPLPIQKVAAAIHKKKSHKKAQLRLKKSYRVQCPDPTCAKQYKRAGIKLHIVRIHKKNKAALLALLQEAPH